MYFIDFAAKYGLEYIVIDAGWYQPGDLLTQIPAMDMPALVQYGVSKHVGIISVDIVGPAGQAVDARDGAV